MTNIGEQRWLALGEAMGWGQGNAPVVPLPGIVIADRAALAEALAAATGGEVFRIGAGDFGALEIKRKLAVTIIGGAFTSIKVSGPNNQTHGGGVTLDGVTASYIDFFNSDDVALLRSAANQVNVKQCKGVTIQRNWLHDGHFPLRILRTSAFEVIGNIMERAREDTMRISGDSHDGEVRGNVFFDSRAASPKHSDFLQIFGLPRESTGPKRIVIEQNLMHDNPAGKAVFHLSDGDPKKGQNWRSGDPGYAAPAQGIFIGDGAGDFTDFTIRHNLIRIAMVNAIASKSGPRDFLVEENIVVSCRAPDRGVARINFGKHPTQPTWNAKGVTVSRNVVTMLDNRTEGEATITADNFAYGPNPDGLFAGISEADLNSGNQPEHYRLAPGSRVPAELVAPWLEDTIAVIRATLDEVRRL